MYAKYIAAIAGRRVSVFLILSGLLAAALLLGSCAGIRQAADAAGQLAGLTPTPAQAGVPGVPTIDTTTATTPATTTASAGTTASVDATPSVDAASAQPTGDRTEAGQVTVTPEASAASQAEATPAAPDTLPQAGVAPAPDPTADGADTGSAAQPIQFTGKIENLPGTGDWTGAWQVAGRLVRVAPGTTVDQRYGRVALGEQVTVEGWPQTDGSLDAVWVIVHGTTPAQPAVTATPLPQSATPANAGDQSAQPNGVATVGPANQQGNDQGQNNQNDQNNQGQNSQGPNNQNDQGGDAQHEQANGQNNNAQNARPVEFRDVVQSMPDNGLVGTWQIGGRTVNVNARTRLQKDAGAVLQPGAIVQVMGWLQPDGSINAVYLMVKKNMNAKGNAGNAGGDQAGPGNGSGKGNGNGHGNGNGNGNGKGKGNGNDNGKGKGKGD